MSLSMNLREIGDFDYVPTPLDDKAINGAMMIEFAKVVIAEYNHEKNENVCFVKIDKGDCDDNLCAGRLYNFSIRVKDNSAVSEKNDEYSEKVIEKMVYKGSSLEEGNKVMMIGERPAKTAKSISRRRIKKMLALAQDLHEMRNPKEKLITKGVVVEEEFLKSISKGKAGYLDCTSYKLYFTFQPGFLCYHFVHRKWLYTLGNDFFDFIPREHYKTPSPEHGDLSEPKTCHAQVVPEKGLRSPMILSFCWYFLARHNCDKDTKLDLDYVIDAKFQLCGGMLGDIRFNVVDQQKRPIYQFFLNIWSRRWLKHVECRLVVHSQLMLEETPTGPM